MFDNAFRWSDNGEQLLHWRRHGCLRRRFNGLGARLRNRRNRRRTARTRYRTVIGMATGAAAGAAVGDAAEKKQRQSVGVPAEEQQQRRPSEREMRARRNQRIQRDKAMQRQRQQMQQNDAEYDDDVYFDAKKPREIDAKKLRTYDAEEPGKPERPMPFYNNEGFPEGQHFKLERIPRKQIDNNVQEEQPQESRLDTDIVVDETNSSDDSFDFEKGE